MASMQGKTLIFEKDSFSRVEVMKWLKSHNLPTSGVKETHESFEFHSPIAKAVSPEYIAKALYPGVDPVRLRAQLIDDNDGFIGGTIRHGDGSPGSEFGSDYDDEGVKRNMDGPLERFSFGDLTFDVDAAKEMCGGVANDEIEVSSKWSFKINVDKVAALNSKSTAPVIIAMIPTTKGLVPLLIDGHHRMYKAQQDGKETIDAYVMSPEESLFICDSHPDMMTTLNKNLRDILDPPDVSDPGMIDKIAKIWSKIIEKAQPGSGVHVPSMMGDEEEPTENQDPPETEYSPGGQTTGSQNEDVGIDIPDFSKKVPRLKDDDEEEALKEIGKLLDEEDAEKGGPGSGPSGDSSSKDQKSNERKVQMLARQAEKDRTRYQAMRKSAEKEVTIVKADKKRQIVYGVVLEPHTVDSQDDVMTPEDIEEAAHKYMENARRVGRRHKTMIDKAFPVESYIAPMDMKFDGGPYGSSIVTKGSWVLGVKVLDPVEWAKVENGEYKAFSVGGTGVRI